MAWIVGIVAALVVVCTTPALAQNYPAKPIHILVPYAPGGITDIASRIVGAKLTEAWGPAGRGGEQARGQRLHRHERRGEGGA